MTLTCGQNRTTNAEISTQKGIKRNKYTRVLEATISLRSWFENVFYLFLFMASATVNPQVAGSSPARGAIKYKGLEAFSRKAFFVE